jgi:hypothetical protein
LDFEIEELIEAAAHGADPDEAEVEGERPRSARDLWRRLHGLADRIEALAKEEGKWTRGK